MKTHIGHAWGREHQLVHASEAFRVEWCHVVQRYVVLDPQNPLAFVEVPAGDMATGMQKVITDAAQRQRHALAVHADHKAEEQRRFALANALAEAEQERQEKARRARAAELANR